MSTPPDADALVAHIRKVKQRGLTPDQTQELKQNLKNRLDRLNKAKEGVQRALDELG